MTLEYVAYIDEAGDEGINKLREPSGQSRWLLLGGILVTAENDRLLPAWRNEALALFPKKKAKDLHFRELKHDQKVAVSSYFSDKRMGVCCVCSNKVTLLDGGKYERLYSQKGHLYNYLTRFLLERLTTSVANFAKRQGQSARLRIVFSRRSGTDYHAMREYLLLMRDGKEKMRPVRSIDWSVFDPDDIRVENHEKWAGLQLADVATSATFSALERNFYGHYEPRYALALAKRYIPRGSSILDCGFTLVPRRDKCLLDERQTRFVSELMEGWRAPGP